MTLLSSLTIYKQTSENVTYYLFMLAGVVKGFMDINATDSGDHWVRHVVTAKGQQGLGLSIYQCVMQDIYPAALMPSRECSSGFSINVWDNLWADTKVTKSPILHQVNYMEELDEHSQEILSLNPTLSESDLLPLEDDFSYFKAVKAKNLIPHKFNHTYAMPHSSGIVISPLPDNLSGAIGQAQDLFDIRYERREVSR